MSIHFQISSWPRPAHYALAGALAGGAALILINGGIALARISTNVYQQEICDAHAFDWAEKSYQSNVLDPINLNEHARRYRAYKTACPAGHVLVNEAIVPDQIKNYRPKR